MLLNLYYKLLWWWAKAAANASGYVTIPLTYFADGAARDKINWVDNTNVYTAPVQQMMFTKPYAGILSQASTPRELRVGSNSALIGYYPNFVVGSGTTPVTADDYKVEKEIVSGLACEAVTASVDEATHTVVFRKTLRNTSEENITISEVGLTGAVRANSTASQALIYREVLQAPVTIAPGDSATIRMAIQHELSI
jgi:hypothetical protein